MQREGGAMEKRIRTGSFSFDLDADGLIGYGGFSSCLACLLSLAVLAPTVVAPELSSRLADVSAITLGG